MNLNRYTKNSSRFTTLWMTLVLIFMISIQGWATTVISSMTVTSSQSATLTYGTASSVTYTIALTKSGNGSGSTSLSINWTGGTAPTGVTTTFSPTSPISLSNSTPATLNVTLTITTTETAPAVSKTFTISNTSNSLTSSPASTFIITPKALTVTATGPLKTYGTALTAGTSTINFTADATGVGTEVVTSVTLTPDAAGLSATTAAGAAYVVTPTAATGTGGFLAGNYNITYTPFNGIVSVQPLTITALNQSKCFGTTFSFSGTEFSSVGLQNEETIGSVTLSSTGVNSEAVVGDYPITISDATGGTFATSNYAITYIGGTMSVKELPTPIITGSATACAGETGSVYSVTDVDEHSYAWTVTGGTITSGDNTNSITVTWGVAGPGTVDVTETITATGCSAAAAQKALTVDALPVITAQPSPLTLCENGSGTFTVVTSDPNPAYQWQYYDEGTSTWLNTDGAEGVSGHTTATLSLTNAPIGYNNISIRCVVSSTLTGCSSNSNSALLTVNALPVSGTLTPTPVVGVICEGADVSAVATAGSGGSGTITEILEYRFDEGEWTAYTSGTSLSTTGHTSVDIQTYRTADGSGCTTSTPVIVSWTVNAVPVSGTLTPSPAAGAVCNGTSVSATATAGTGGVGTIADILEYRFDGGSWTAYTSGTNLSTAGHISVEIQSFRTADGSVCTTSIPVVVSWSISALPASGTLTPTPSAGAVCNGTSVSAVATAGTGGVGTIADILEYRFNGGPWTAYTSGTNLSTAGYASVDIQTYRTADGSGCTTSTPTVVSWTINEGPLSGTLTPSPAIGTVCNGTSVSAVATAGTGGIEPITDILEYRFDGGTWTTYNSGTSLNTSGHTSVDIQTYRTADGSVCTTSIPVVVSWSINTPVVSITGPTSICVDGNTTLSPTTGGTWVSNNEAVAMVVPTTGVVIGLTPGSATFTFTETATGCSSTTSAVPVYAKPTQAAVGIDQSIAGSLPLTSGSLGGNPPSGGETGLWTKVSGPPAGNVAFSSPSNPVATAQVDAYGAYTFRWSISNANCSTHDDITVNYSSKVSVTDGSWSDGATWNPSGVPVSTDDVTVAHAVTIGSAVTGVCKNLAVSSGKSLTIAAGGALTVSGNLTNNGAFTINSDASVSGSLIVEGTSTGNVTYNRYVEPGRWYITASPVNAFTSNSFSATNEPNIGKAGDGTYDFATLDEGANVWDYPSAIPDPARGKGYLTRLKTGQNNIAYTGTLNTGFNATVVSSVDVHGWNAIGNPFTSSIGVATGASSTKNFLGENASKLDPDYAAIYLWNQTGTYNETQDYYKVISNSGYTPPDGYENLGVNLVQAGQGFLVNVSTGNSLSFTREMQLHNTTESLKSAEISWPGITLKAENSGNTRTTVVAFNSNMTEGIDKTYDAGLFSASDFNVYTHLANNMSQTDLAIQCLPEGDWDKLSVPIGLDLPDGGDVIFKAAGVILPDGLFPVIEDRQLKRRTALKSETDSYKVTLTGEVAGTGRFYLHIGGVVMPDDPNELINTRYSARYDNERITIFGNVAEPTKAILYDLMGRKLGEYPLLQDNYNDIPAVGLTQRVYLLKLEGKDYRQVIKVPVAK